MPPVFDDDGLPLFSMPERLHAFLLRNREKIMKEDTMILGIICGKVGCGKSVLAQKFAYVISGKMDISKIAFDGKEFLEAVLSSRKESIIGDEGISLFFSRGVMTKQGRLMAELMAQIRQKNLCVLICIPNLLSVDTMILEMSNFICFVWESRATNKGYKYCVKGNLALYPAFRHNNYKERLLNFYRMRRANPKFIRRPFPYLTATGEYYHADKPAFYNTDIKLYLKKKESILAKYTDKVN